MFKKRAIQIKLVEETPAETQTFVLDVDHLNEVVKDQVRNLGLVLAGVYIAKNLSSTVSNVIANVGWRFIDVKLPYKS